MDRGLVTFVFGNRITVAPPLTLSDAEAADGLAILDEVLSIADGQAQASRPGPRMAADNF